MTICYTSGTTGAPKGVMIIQRNMIAMLETVIIDAGVPVDENAAHISFLPLAHIFERMVLSGFLSLAARVGFLSGPVKDTLLSDIAIFKPTLLFTVPRVLQTFHQKIFKGFDSLPCLQRQLIYKAYHTKLENFKKYGIITHAFYDCLVFSKIRKIFGGQLRTLLCASAPLPKQIGDDFKILLSVPLVEGWGMTELTGSGFCSNQNDLLNNSAGGVTQATKMKIKEKAKLGYTRNSVYDNHVWPSGEIYIKGPITCIGYYKKPEETAKAFDEEGYIRTGDIGCITHYGNGIRIIDRVKEIFKLSQGEYIIPAKLENVYSKSKYITQILIYGNSMKNNIIGIITPDKRECLDFLKLQHNEDFEKYKDNESLNEEIRNDLEALAKEANFNS